MLRIILANSGIKKLPERIIRKSLSITDSSPVIVIPWLFYYSLVVLLVIACMIIVSLHVIPWITAVELCCQDGDTRRNPWRTGWKEKHSILKY